MSAIKLAVINASSVLTDASALQTQVHHKRNRNHASGLRAHSLTRAAWFAMASVAIAVSASVFYTRPVAEVRATIDEAVPVFANTNISPADRQKQLREIAARHFDFAYMARSAMGTHWKGLTPAQRKEFVPLFTDHVIDTYVGKFAPSAVEAASVGLKVSYDGTDRATVYSVVRLPSLADPLAVNYSLRKGEGGWKLCDIVVDNVSSMVANYRDEFNQKMNHGGYAKLVNDLRSEPPPQAD